MKRKFLKAVLTIVFYTVTTNGIIYSKPFAKETVNPNLSGNTVNNIPEHNLKTVHLKFELENSGYVLLNMYNSKGELIETIADGDMEAGEYNVFFKTVERIESGDCYYTISINGKIILKKTITF